jgi:hypothetical protein
MNSTTNPAGHLRDRDLECARDVVAWAAIDAVQFMGTEDFGLATMEKVGLLARLIDHLGVDVAAEPRHGALDDGDVTALRFICGDVAKAYPGNDPLVADRVRKAEAVLAALRAA